MILDEEALTDGKINIIAYFTVSTKALNLREGISKNVRKHLDGLGNKRSSTFVVYLIGQLGKNAAHRSEIDGNELVARRRNEESFFEGRVHGFGRRTKDGFFTALSGSLISSVKWFLCLHLANDNLQPLHKRRNSHAQTLTQ